MNLMRLAWPVLAALAPLAAAAAEVTIYRCTDANGQLTLRDTPCGKGQQQNTRTMLRPTDPPPRPARAASLPATPALPPERTRVVVMTAPRPLYECITPEGERYTSENDAGQPRWVPLWTVGYPVWPAPPVRYPGVHGHIGGRLGRDGRYDLHFGDPQRPRPPPPPPGHPLPHTYAAGGTWVRDSCHRLPAQEACARLSDRRYELDRRYHSALQSERVRITTEQRGIDAQLAQDCGAN